MKFYFHILSVLCCVAGTLPCSNAFVSLPAIRQRASACESNSLSLARVHRTLIVTEVEKGTDLWYATNFTIGDGHDLTMLIDAGSSGILLNKGV